MVRQMAKRGLVERHRSREDARAKIVSITRAGRDALKAAKAKIEEVD